MSLIIYDFEQHSPEWVQARLGIPTSSQFATILAQGRGGGESKTRRTYMMKLLGERITGEPMWTYSNEHMDRGREMETEALGSYQSSREDPKEKDRNDRNLRIKLVGFIKNPVLGVGCSPDALVDVDGILEIKTKLPHLQIECLLDGVLPEEHKAQVHGLMWVAKRQWVDFVSYWPKIPLFKIRIERDEAYIKRLATEVKRFQKELESFHQRIETDYSAFPPFPVLQPAEIP
jgi:hypothetical protein